MSAISPAHARLRAASAPDHARVDACFPRGLEDAATYRRYLRGMHGLLSALARACPRLADEYAPMREALAADLEALGSTPPAPPGLPPITDEAARLGARYVIEGSAMGARLLQRQAERLGHGPGPGGRFLAYHVARGEHAWPALKSALARLDADTASFEDVLRSTRDTFALAATCFDGHATPRE